MLIKLCVSGETTLTSLPWTLLFGGFKGRSLQNQNNLVERRLKITDGIKPLMCDNITPRGRLNMPGNIKSYK